MTRSTMFRRGVLVTAMILLVPGLALAGGKGPTGTHRLKCRSIGSFYNPAGLIVTSSSIGRCSAGLSKVTTASVSTLIGGPDVASGPNCIFIDSVAEDFAIGKNGFITFTNLATQCFEDVSGIPLAGLPVGFCGAGPLEAYFSTVTGTYAITGGLVNGTPVIGGAGRFKSFADHCAGGTAPFGNFFRTKLVGTIEFP